MGFLALNDGKTNGNFGIGDQINALDWVIKNIQDFGGDPNRITIFGQSAGANSVRALMGSPRAIGKFIGAIPVSPLGGINYGAEYGKYYTIEEEMEVVGNTILAETGCADAPSPVDCLRGVPPNEIEALSTRARFLVVDGTYLTATELPLEGPTVPFRIMMGITRDDAAPMVTFPNTTDQAAYLKANGFEVPPSDLFPIPPIANETLALFQMANQLATDGIFRCIDQATVYTGLRNDRFQPVYYYEFNRTYAHPGWPNLDVCEAPITPSHPNGDPDGEYLKCHSGDLYYIFGNLGRAGLPMRDEADLPFEQFVVDSFASFARSLDPNPTADFLQARGYLSTLGEVRW